MISACFGALQSHFCHSCITLINRDKHSNSTATYHGPKHIIQLHDNSFLLYTQMHNSIKTALENTTKNNTAAFQVDPNFLTTLPPIFVLKSFKKY